MTINDIERARSVDAERSLPLDSQMLAYVDFDEEPPTGEYTRPSETADLGRANLITSKVVGQPESPRDPFGDLLFGPHERHKVVLDIDLPVTVLPSTTAGHHHLFIDHEVAWDDYVNLLEALATCRLIEPGYLYASKQRGYSCVRLPWVKKVEPTEPVPVTPDDAALAF
jgi:hypothetical protein